MSEEKQVAANVSDEVIGSDGKLRVLFFKSGAIGDVIMTTPLIRQFKKNFPDAKIDYLVADYCKPVLEGNPNIDEIITFDQNIFLKKRMFEWLKLVRQMRAKKYDMIFVLDKHKIYNGFAKFFGVKKRIGFNRAGDGLWLTTKIPFDGKQHEIYSFLDLLKAIKLKTEYDDVQTELILSKEDLQFAEEFWKNNDLKNKKVICMAPGGANNPGQNSYKKPTLHEKITDCTRKLLRQNYLIHASNNGYQKVWPKEKYLELTKKLIDKNYWILLVGDKNDVAIAKYIIDNLDTNHLINIIDATGKTTIKQTASLMKKCEYVICNDTGAMHIAGSVNKRVISLFGPTRAKRFAPLAKESKAIQSNISCFDCYDIFGNFGKCGHKDVIRNIKVEEVLNCIK